MDWLASLPMYDFAELSAATEMFWAAIASGLRRRGWVDVPSALIHGDDVHQMWHDPAMLMSQACGWPLVDDLDGVVTTIGAFQYSIPSAAGPTYRSRIVMRSGMRTPTKGELASLRAAVNSAASLSGFHSLVHTFPELAGRWPSDVTHTGSHAASLALLQRGEADIAAIDEVSWHLLARHRPSLVADLAVVGHGPRIPCPPIIAAGSLTNSQIADVRASIVDAIRSPAGVDACPSLLIEEFWPLDRGDYQPVRTLQSWLAPLDRRTATGGSVSECG
jgi:ABC-type phosphate/phosphonate transport system substrate-binding protein